MSLPPLILFHGDWDAYIEELYAIYIDEIYNGNMMFKGQKVSCRHHPEVRGKGKGFWHCIQEGIIEEERLPDFRRCERIRWIPWVLANSGIDPNVSWWAEPNRSGEDIVFWIEEENYVVILGKRRDYYLLRSAYYVDRPHKIKALNRNREKYKTRLKD